MPVTILGTSLLLVLSNLFMTMAWYGHLKWLHGRAWWIAVLASWGIAFFEYLIQVPANRIGATVMSVAQLKILQEVITLCVFAPFAVVVLGAKLGWNFAYAGACMAGAVYFVFRGQPRARTVELRPE